jgi:hypothetical protein
VSQGSEDFSFSAGFDDEVVAADGRSHAFFGRNVLRGLIEGIDAFIGLWEGRSRARSLGPALLGSAMWIDDEELLKKLEDLSAACIVVTKQRRDQRKLGQLQRLRELNERTPGMPTLSCSCWLISKALNFLENLQNQTT